MADAPPYRYDARLAGQIELRWQERWAKDGTFHTPNPSGDLSDGFAATAGRPKLYVLDMFPYPSGDGLHVGHPLGYIGTDVYCRFKTATGFNVLHTMGFDAFGLPAEQYALESGRHPRETTEQNIARMRAQMERLGLGYDWRRSIATTDVDYYRWTQWIFLQLFNSWFDPAQGRARPISELPAGLDPDEHRLVYREEALVNWCPALGTVLANEEVTADGRSERGNHPVVKAPLLQWKMRITAYAQRLLADLDLLDWPEPIKVMQRNWIGRSSGARVLFPAGDSSIEVYTTRPDTLFGATFMVVAPEYPALDELVARAWPAGTDPSWTRGDATPGAAIARYRAEVAGVGDVERVSGSRAKTAVFTGSYATNPVNGEEIPVFVADYVLATYGTGAIMAVPAHDQRDFEMARALGLPVRCVVEPPADWLASRGVDDPADASGWPKAYEGEGRSTASSNAEISLNGMQTAQAKEAITAWLEGTGRGHGAVAYKLRDWLFSRQRYWGEPIPLVYDDQGRVHPLQEGQLPVELPELTDYKPEISEEAAGAPVPKPPLERATSWVTVTLDLGDGPRRYRRETNTMPQWAGSCWYYLRYLDPHNDRALVDPEIERYWMAPGPDGGCGGVDLYVGGVEHAVLHLLYARFWHKVLYDLGHVSSPEPFRRLFNQGYVLAPAYTDERGVYVPAAEVREKAGSYEYKGRPVNREYGKMGKSLKNSVTPEEMYEAYGADTLRLYEMFSGPLDASRPWETEAVVGVFRFLQRVWRLVVDEDTGAVRVSDEPLDDGSRRELHRSIEAVRAAMETMRFNVALARLMELATTLGRSPQPRREGVVPLVLMLAPLAPHICEELWSRLGGAGPVVREPFPEADPELTRRDRVTIAVQVKGKLRGTVEVPAGAPAAEAEAAARCAERVASHLAGGTWRAIVVPDRLVNFVPA